MRYYRWGDNDRRYGPLIVARPDWNKWGFVFVAPDDGAQVNVFRLYLGKTTLILVMPQWVKPYRWFEKFSSPVIASGRDGYWDTDEQSFGVYLSEGTVHMHYGRQANDSDKDKSKCWFLPWQQWRIVRRTFHGPGFVRNVVEGAVPPMATWALIDEAKKACPRVQFSFQDYDGETITASTYIEEWVTRRGEGWFKWLSLFSRTQINRRLNMHFSREVGREKGSWKGGVVGTSIAMLPGEDHRDAFERYCMKADLLFLG